MNLTSISEIIAGLVLIHKISPSAINPTDLEQPYNQIVIAMREGADEGGVIDKVGFSPVNTCSAAAESLNDTEDVGKYIKLLETISARQEIGTEMMRYAKKLVQGEDIDAGKALSCVSRLNTGLREFTTMDKVTPEANIWIPTYWDLIDKYFGGTPRYGMNIIAAPPGSGKSSFLIQLMDAQTKQGKEFGLFSFEMTKEVDLARWLEINPKVTKKQRSLVHITDDIYDIDEAYTKIAQLVAAHPNIYAIGLDFADMMIPDDKEESTEMASKIYRVISTAAKRIQRPIWLLSQLSRSYVGGIPHVTDVRWSGLAEAFATLIVLLYNPDQIFADMGQRARAPKLPYVEDKAYIIEGKSRFGYHMGGMGAIQTDWLKIGGWGSVSNAEWFSL